MIKWTLRKEDLAIKQLWAIGETYIRPNQIKYIKKKRTANIIRIFLTHFKSKQKELFYQMLYILLFTII